MVLLYVVLASIVCAAVACLTRSTVVRYAAFAVAVVAGIVLPLAPAKLPGAPATIDDLGPPAAVSTHG